MNTEPDKTPEKEAQTTDFDPVLTNFRGSNDEVNDSDDASIYGVPF